MEEVLDRPVRRECKLSKNSSGTYDLTIIGENGQAMLTMRNLTFRRAVTVIENNMYQNGGRS